MHSIICRTPHLCRISKVDHEVIQTSRYVEGGVRVRFVGWNCNACGASATEAIGPRHLLTESEVYEIKRERGQL